ncbi:MAG: SDR family oxidoreductase [Rhodospirillaceae bacterium]|jgi:nucleoside-diphosphate-sugar epimerase|nr:SDR family oxidoreductase [Rhodospirillaceae bacterium]MBT4218506.1 SDR family oxidoreductase [Rhodospirillaceae bacterium]MBT4464886.1 SDR family oxidoreductase [Rhodospirillaceae bacterium]MBT5014093.1 SDR family oxidoreductase [Rhodospirillaceae bacterium]MBT5308374.1 SDR family oxidoreductase [Rhodospirillaceae bacterium]
MNAESDNKLFCFGLGYSATRLAKRLLTDGWAVSGTCREQAHAAELRSRGIDVQVFDREHTKLNPSALAGTTHLLSSVPPDDKGDAVLDCFATELRTIAPSLKWTGYLSTTGVYGNRNGATVTENDALNPVSDRSRRRAGAEGRWLAMGAHIFRLAGIYGPGRSVIEDIHDEKARCIDKPGHKFSRIHVDDIANVLMASMNKPAPGSIYNVADDEAAAPADVITYTCELMGVPTPPLVPFAEAEAEMSLMQRSFWADNKRVDNSRIKNELGVELAWPTYREGLRALVQDL